MNAAEKRLGLPKVGLHGLRHTNAHLLKDSGVSRDIRMDRLGHSTAEMDRLYSGASETADRAAADALDSVIGGKG